MRFVTTALEWLALPVSLAVIGVVSLLHLLLDQPWRRGWVPEPDDPLVGPHIEYTRDAPEVGRRKA